MFQDSRVIWDTWRVRPSVSYPFLHLSVCFRIPVLFETLGGFGRVLAILFFICLYVSGSPCYLRHLAGSAERKRSFSSFVCMFQDPRVIWDTWRVRPSVSYPFLHLSVCFRILVLFETLGGFGRALAILFFICLYVSGFPCYLKHLAGSAER